MEIIKCEKDLFKSSPEQILRKAMCWVAIEKISETLPHRLLDKTVVVISKVRNRESVQCSSHVGIPRMWYVSFVKMLVDFKLFCVTLIACIKLQCDISTPSTDISIEPSDKDNRLDLLKITSEPYRGSDTKPQLIDNLIFGPQNITYIDRIVVPSSKLFKPFFFEDLGWTDCSKSGGWKVGWEAKRREGCSLKRYLDPFDKWGQGVGLS